MTMCGRRSGTGSARPGATSFYSRHFDSWTASFTRGAPEAAVIDSPSLLNNADLAVLAVCWLHLRFLPAENSRLPVDDDALFASEEPQEIPARGIRSGEQHTGPA